MVVFGIMAFTEHCLCPELHSKHLAYMYLILIASYSEMGIVTPPETGNWGNLLQVRQGLELRYRPSSVVGSVFSAPDPVLLTR